MAVTADELAAIRDHIGTGVPPTDGDLAVVWEWLGSVEAVALSVVRGRLADMRNRPAVLKVDGDYEENFTANLQVLAEQEAALAGGVAIAAGSGFVSVARLTRAGRRR